MPVGPHCDGHQTTLGHFMQGEQGGTIPYCDVDSIAGVDSGCCSLWLQEGEEDRVHGGPKRKPSHVLKKGGFGIIE